MTNVVRFPLALVEDALIDIGALVRFGLFRLEQSDPPDMAQMKSDLVTLLYLIQEKTMVADKGFSAHAHRQKGKGYE